MYHLIYRDYELCELCSTPIVGFLYEHCCSGIECGCGGQPIEPCVCDDCMEMLGFDL